MPIPIEKRYLFNGLLDVIDVPARVQIVEKDPGGSGIFEAQINAPSATLTVNGQKIFFCVSGQCADGGIIVSCDDGIHIHLIELKSKLSSQKWDAAKAQLEGMYHNLIAVAVIAGLPNPAKITCHVAYSDDAISAHPVLSKAVVSANGVINSSAAEWMSGSVTIAGVSGVHVLKHHRDAAGNVAVTINC